MYAVLKNLMLPGEIKTQKFETVISKLKDYYCPKQLVISERYKFNSRKQKEGESVNDFIIELRRLASSCKFDAFLDQALRDRLVASLSDDIMVRKLLAEPSALSFDSACKTVMDMDTVRKNTAVMHERVEAETLSIRQKFKNQSSKLQSHKHEDVSSKAIQKKKYVGERNSSHGNACGRCGRKSHSKSECPAKDWVCFNCSKKGHTSHMCRNNKKSVNNVEINNVFSNALKTTVCINDITFLDFEVDSGAAVTLLPMNVYNAELSGFLLQPSEVRLITANWKSMKTMGRDWLDIVNPLWRSQIVCTKQVEVLVVNDRSVEKFKVKYPKVFSNNVEPIKVFEATIVLKENVVPVFLRAYDVPYAIRDQVIKELNALESQGIITKVSHSQWASPIVCVPRKNGKIRLCVDLKVTVNRYVEMDYYPLPKIDDIFNSLSGCKYFCVLDLTNAYLQLSVADSCKHLLTVNTHVGLYCFNRLCFGLKSAPPIFQSVMDSVVRGIPRVAAYLDDVVVGGANLDECKRHLGSVLSRFEKYNIKINTEKCHFFKESIDYLGYRLNGSGLYPNPEKVDAIKNAPVPVNVTQLKSYLGLLNYYHTFLSLSSLSDVMEPLLSLTRKKSEWNWSSKCERAFIKTKDLIAEKSCLVLYNSNLPLVVATDSSSYNIGAVLSHIIDDREHPIMFASTTLSETEKRYMTDHEPLKQIFNPSKSIPQLSAARLQRWAIILAAYNYEIVFKKGECNSNADGLSRLPLESKESVDNECCLVSVVASFEEKLLTFKNIEQETCLDDILVKVVGCLNNGWPHFSQLNDELKPFYKNRLKLSLESGCILFGNRVVIPKRLQVQVLDILHKGHPGIVRCKLLARSYVWWPTIEVDILKYVQSCMPCQVNQYDKIKKIYAPLPETSQTWMRLHLDLFDAQQCKFLILIDDYSKWIEVWLMQSTDTKSVVDKLKSCFACFGLPAIVLADKEPPFNSENFKQFLLKNNIKYMNSPPYNPTSNGLAERGVQTIKKYLLKNVVAGCPPGKEVMKDKLLGCLSNYRNTPCTTTQVAPAELMFKFRTRTQLSWLIPKSKVQLDLNTPVTREFSIDDKVLIKKNFINKKGYTWELGRVTKKIGSVVYLVKVNEKIRKVHLNQMRKSYLANHLHSPKSLSVCEDLSFSNLGSHSNNTTNINDTLGTKLTTRRYPERERKAPDRYQP
ncbi:unnamed protein product [Macrosiphum euphorbiae]|uniref:RNA-directed DNA polymerase n=1 Tax=Macrosiphum euphorbiae TaxID=13131 RepID=A0AAV0WL17_9HEMI|nr:unnamed protein product [Macrosiphum euphorbiae]